MEAFPEEIQEIIKKNEDPGRRIRAKEEKEMAIKTISEFIRSNNSLFENLLDQLLKKSSYASCRLYNDIIKQIIKENPPLKANLINYLMTFETEELFQPQTCIEALESYFSLLAAYIPRFNDQSDASITFEELCDYLNGKELTQLQLCLLLHYKNQIKNINASLFNVFEEEEKKAEAIASSLKACYFIPKVSNQDSDDPTVSKFGGACPYLPSQGKHICPNEGCGEEADLVFSLYVGSLPGEIQQYFPEDKRETLIVGTFCTKCGSQLPISVYTKEQIQELEYADPSDKPFNEPRIVTGWKRGMMTPKSLENNNQALTGLSAPLDIYFVKSKLQKLSSPESPTYIGGYPDGDPKNTISPAKLLLQMGESEASTNSWGEYGTAQIWLGADSSLEFVISFE